MDSGFIIVTAAHNEASFIENTCRSIVSQSVRPSKWIVVDDASQDGTAAIVARYRDVWPQMIELLHLQRPAGRDFGNKARAFAVGLERAHRLGYRFIGNLDADISLPEHYYARMLKEFAGDTQLGIVGGMVASCIGGKYVRQEVALDSVAGAVQLFRSTCFDAVGGYVALPLGGIDAAAEIKARMQGWRVRTLPDVQVLEHRRTGSATSNPLRARLREGRRLYSLGYAPSFFAARCLRRAVEHPKVLGSLAALAGYAWEAARGGPRALPPQVIDYLRSEQRAKLSRLLRRPAASR